MKNIPQDTKEIDLFEAILLLENKDEIKRFLTDLCTPQELKAFKERWRVCQLLATGELSYRDIHHQLGASLTTIGRVARFLKEESNKGYELLLEKIKSGEIK